MSEIHHFVPRANLSASENLTGFIESCRSQLTVFGGDLDFDADVWDVTAASDFRGSSNSSRITFCTLATTNSRIESDPMAEPFRSFAKAYIRYQQGLRPTKTQSPRMAALRVLEQAIRLRDGDFYPDPSTITVDLFNQAAELTRRHYEAGTAYRVGVALEVLAQFLDEHRLTPAATSWKNPIKRPQEGERIGQEFERRRDERMPSAAALDALAVAFNVGTETRDVIQASVGALLMSVPARIAELLTLPEDCEVNAPAGSDPSLYGIRWWPAKGAAPQIKWVIPSMVDIAIVVGEGRFHGTKC